MRGGIWRAVSVDLFTDPLFRGNDELVAWLLIVMRYARAFDDADRGLRRGQFRASLAELTRRFQKSVEQDPARRGDARWTVGKTRAFITRLEKHGALSSARSMDETGRPVTLFTVENYEKWQQTERTPNNKPNADRTTNQNAVPVGTPDTPATDRTTNRTQTEQRTERTHRETGSLETGFLETETREKPKARARVVSDETGIEWPEPSSPKFKYPDSYKAMWADWQDASKVCLVTANGKLAAYKQIRRHLKTKTLTLAQLQDATANFLDKYRSSPTLFGAPQPPRFYGKQGEVFEYLQSRKEEDAKPTQRPMRKRWSAPYTAWSCCVTVCEEFDLPIPEKEGRASWEDVQKFHPLVIANASDDHQLRRPPEDLREQVMT